jgi:hypothetical protein
MERIEIRVERESGDQRLRMGREELHSLASRHCLVKFGSRAQLNDHAHNPPPTSTIESL